MNDLTNWNVADVGSFEFASTEEAKKAEAVLNRAMRESFENGKNVALEEAAAICERWPLSAENMNMVADRHGDWSAKLAGVCRADLPRAIRALRRPKGDVQP